MSRLVPKLRFREFSGEWEEKRLDELLEFKNGINATKEQYGSGYKFINVLDILNNEFIIHKKIIGRVDVDEIVMNKNIVEYGDILFQRSSETQDEVGTASVYLDKENTATFGGFVIRGKKIGDYEPIFLNKILKTNLSRNQITLKSAGSTRYNVGQGILASVFLPFPLPSEQQKIANCLSSLDNLIESQNKKVEALKKHKKGLMQGLFPREGEKEPKNRFEGFSGDWEEVELGKYVDILSGESPSKFEFVNNGIAYYKVEQLNNSEKYLKNSIYNIKYSKKIAKKGSLVFPKRGASIFLNKIRILLDDSFIDTNLMSLYVKNNLLNEFLYYYLLYADLSKIADTTSIPQINNKHIEPYTLYLPKPKEQEKIANCLSSLDNLIEAQNKKVEALKKHKKGLMQGLFVSSEVSK